jgi:hypothetical protein
MIGGRQCFPWRLVGIVGLRACKCGAWSLRRCAAIVFALRTAEHSRLQVRYPINLFPQATSITKPSLTITSGLIRPHAGSHVQEEAGRIRSIGVYNCRNPRLSC